METHFLNKVTNKHIAEKLRFETSYYKIDDRSKLVKYLQDIINQLQEIPKAYGLEPFQAYKDGPLEIELICKVGGKKVAGWLVFDVFKDGYRVLLCNTKGIEETDSVRKFAVALESQIAEAAEGNESAGKPTTKSSVKTKFLKETGADPKKLLAEIQEIEKSVCKAEDDLDKKGVTLYSSNWAASDNTAFGKIKSLTTDDVTKAIKCNKAVIDMYDYALSNREDFETDPQKYSSQIKKLKAQRQEMDKKAQQLLKSLK